MLPPEYKIDQVTLKPYVAEDVDRYLEMVLDATSIRFMGGASGDEVEEREVFKKIFHIYQRSETRWFWIWGIYQDQKLCGHLELKQSDHTEADELEIVYMVHPAERGKGVMSEVLEFLKQHQRNWQKRIIATVNPENRPSITLLKRWGIDEEKMLISRETGEQFLKLRLSE